MRERIDRVALLLARYVRGLPLEPSQETDPSLVASHLAHRPDDS